jgi:predicted phage terminase large subunit-like protein
VSKDARIKLLPKQGQFLQSTAKGTIYRGGLGSGKTRILCYKAIENALIRGRRECIVAATYRILADVVLNTMLSCLPLYGCLPSQNCYVNRTDMRVSFPGRGEILLRSGDNPDALRGLNLHDFFVDEARLFEDSTLFEVMLGRLRNSDDCQWYICSSPCGKDWVWKLSSNADVLLIVQKTAENTFLPSGYIESMRAQYTSRFAAQELDAEIVEIHGGVIDPSKFVVVPYIHPSGGCRFWDLAVSEKKSADWSVGALCLFSGANFCVADVVRRQLIYPKLKELIVATAVSDGTDIVIGVEQAGQQQAIIDDLRVDQRLRMHTIKAMKPRGDKLARAMPWASQAELGRMSVMDGPWLQEFKDECAAFTGDNTHKYDDQIDAVSGSYAVLSHKGNAAYVSLPV